MEDEKTMIELIGIKRTRPILSYVRHKIEGWIEREQSLRFLPNFSSYRVTITRENEPPHYTCKIQIQIGDRRWFGVDSAKSLQEAMERALHHVSIDPLLMLSRIQTISRSTESVA